MKADQMSAHLQPLPTSHVHDVTPHFPHITGMRFTTSSTSSIIIWAHSGHLSSPWCFPQATITSFPSGKATQSCFPVAGPTSHLKMTRPPGFFFFFFFGNQSWKKMVYKQQNALLRVRSGDKTTKCRHLCIKEPKYRGLEGEDNECRLCKHCGCMLKTDYIWLHKSRKLTLTLCGLIATCYHILCNVQVGSDVCDYVMLHVIRSYQINNNIHEYVGQSKAHG